MDNSQGRVCETYNFEDQHVIPKIIVQENMKTLRLLIINQLSTDYKKGTQRKCGNGG